MMVGSQLDFSCSSSNVTSIMMSCRSSKMSVQTRLWRLRKKAPREARLTQTQARTAGASLLLASSMSACSDKAELARYSSCLGNYWNEAMVPARMSPMPPQRLSEPSSATKYASFPSVTMSVIPLRTKIALPKERAISATGRTT